MHRQLWLLNLFKEYCIFSFHFNGRFFPFLKVFLFNILIDFLKIISSCLICHQFKALLSLWITFVLAVLLRQILSPSFYNYMYIYVWYLGSVLRWSTSPSHWSQPSLLTVSSLSTLNWPILCFLLLESLSSISSFLAELSRY